MRGLSAERREDILERLMTDYGDQVMKTCLLFLRNRHLAEDAAQETFFRAWRALDRFREGETEKAWLMKITVNVCRTASKARPGWIPAEQVPEAGALDRYPDDTVLQAVYALPAKYRSPVILFYYHGFSADETARILHLPGATVRTRLSRARTRLKEELKGWYAEDER